VQACIAQAVSATSETLQPEVAVLQVAAVMDVAQLAAVASEAHVTVCN
jgi:hypothetical protein